MATDLNHLRHTALRMLNTHYREPFQFRLEVEGYPHDDFDLYVTEVSYGPIEIETDPEKVGMQNLAYPSGAQPVTVVMTVRDHEDRRVSKWFAARVARMVNLDGTVNLPTAYLLKIRRFSLLHDGGEVETDVWEVVPTQLGDVTESTHGEGLLEFPITFIQFRS